MIPEPHQWLPDHPWFFDQSFEPPIVGVHRSLQAKVEKTSRVPVHQGGDSKPFRETTEFTQRGSALLKIHEVRLHSALSKKTQRLASVCTLSRPENLHLPNW
jgi:hypothetical protein